MNEITQIKVLLRKGFSRFTFVKPNQKHFCQTFLVISSNHKIVIIMTIPYIILLYNYDFVVPTLIEFVFKTWSRRLYSMWHRIYLDRRNLSLSLSKLHFFIHSSHFILFTINQESLNYYQMMMIKMMMI